ncbi:MAG: hypothetical protein IJY43_01075 [Clostridia bacterium]|nr:hypothetical protein [Clostridia bacterium]
MVGFGAEEKAHTDGVRRFWNACPIAPLPRGAEPHILRAVAPFRGARFCGA